MHDKISLILCNPKQPLDANGKIRIEYLKVDPGVENNNYALLQEIMTDLEIMEGRNDQNNINL